MLNAGLCWGTFVCNTNSVPHLNYAWFVNTLHFKMVQGRHSAREEHGMHGSTGALAGSVSAKQISQSIIPALSLLDPLQEVTRQETFTAGDSDALLMASSHHAQEF